MKKLAGSGLRVLLLVCALIVVAGLAGVQSRLLAQGLPDLVPTGLSNFGVTQRLGGPTLEFATQTANIGGQDFDRPRDPDTQQLLLRQIYEYVLYNRQFISGQGWSWVEIDRRRKNTICTIDDHVVFPCLSQHGATHFCGFNQGISQGWVDDYFRGLTGQWVFIGDFTGRFLLEVVLDPDADLQRGDIPDSGRDGDPTNNFADVFFTWDGATLGPVQVNLSFDPGSICPMTPKK